MKHALVALCIITLLASIIGYHAYAIEQAYDAGFDKATSEMDSAILAAKVNEDKVVEENQAAKEKSKIVYKEKVIYVKQIQDNFGQCVMSNERFLYLRSLHPSASKRSPDDSDP